MASRLTAANLTEAAPSGLLCTVCYELLHLPKFAIPCAHTLCQGCWDRLLLDGVGSTACPVCRAEVVEEELRPSFGHQEWLDSLSATCGCGWQGKSQHYGAHVARCPTVVIPDLERRLELAEAIKNGQIARIQALEEASSAEQSEIAALRRQIRRQEVELTAKARCAATYREQLEEQRHLINAKDIVISEQAERIQCLRIQNLKNCLGYEEERLHLKHLENERPMQAAHVLRSTLGEQTSVRIKSNISRLAAAGSRDRSRTPRRMYRTDTRADVSRIEMDSAAVHLRGEDS